MQMFKSFYGDLVPVYYGQGGIFFCCRDCVFVDDGSRQDCLKSKVNILHCKCLSDNEKFILPSNVCKDTRGMIFEAYAERIMDFKEYTEQDKNLKQLFQRRFEVKTPNMQMVS